MKFHHQIMIFYRVTETSKKGKKIRVDEDSALEKSTDVTNLLVD